MNLLCWPSLAALLDPKPGQHILDIACGNGLTSRRLAALPNMALFDMADTETPFQTLPKLLKPIGIFIFSHTPSVQ